MPSELGLVVSSEDSSKFDTDDKILPSLKGG